jgi:hypothetical protein
VLRPDGVVPRHALDVDAVGDPLHATGRDTAT